MAVVGMLQVRVAERQIIVILMARNQLAQHAVVLGLVLEEGLVLVFHQLPVVLLAVKARVLPAVVAGMLLTVLELVHPVLLMQINLIVKVKQAVAGKFLLIAAMETVIVMKIAAVQTVKVSKTVAMTIIFALEEAAYIQGLEAHA